MITAQILAQLGDPPVNPPPPKWPWGGVLVAAVLAILWLVAPRLARRA